MTSEHEAIESWLAKPLWPWPLALAYSQPAGTRERAISAAVEILELYPSIDWKQFTAAGSVHRVYEAVTQFEGVSGLDWSIQRDIETPLLGAISRGHVTAVGRKTPSSLFENIRVEDWTGAEVDAEAASDLIKAGWREKNGLNRVFDHDVRIVWFYDIHLRRPEMLAAFGEYAEPTPDAAPDEVWSHDRMKSEIASCHIGNREKAWRDHFAPMRDKHGWSNTAFREIWSEGRDSRGATGRPAKRA